MSHSAINSGIARATCGLVMLVLLSSVFTFIVGSGGKGVTSSGQAARSVPEPDGKNDLYPPGIADVAFIDSSHAWAINQSGTTLYRVDKGMSVQKRATNFGGRPLISFVDRKTGFAFAREKLWRTTDAGQSWENLPDFNQTNPDLHLTVPRELHFVDERHGWLADVFGVWRTEDGGAHWQRVYSTADLDELLQVSFRGSEHAVVAAKQGVYLTVDGGKNWQSTNKNKMFRAVYSLDERTSWAWGDWLERTDDGGNTWRNLYQLNGRMEILSTHFINKNEGWAAGFEVPESFGSRVRNPDAPHFYPILLHTKDGGKNWDHAAMPNDTAFYRVSFSDAKHGWLLGKDRLYRTVDGGRTWTTALEASANR